MAMRLANEWSEFGALAYEQNGHAVGDCTMLGARIPID